MNFHRGIGVKNWEPVLIIVAALSVSLALAEDFKTINGKEYKNATIRRLESDGIVLRTNVGISKVYFIELPKEVQERFLPCPPPQIGAAPRGLIVLKSWVVAMANPTSFVLLFAVLLAAARFAASRGRNGCFRRSSSRDPEAHPASRQIANRSCPSVGVGGNRGLREKHPTQPHRSDLALAVHLETRIGNDPCGMGRNLPIARSKCDFPFE